MSNHPTRPERILEFPEALRGERIVITGAAGSIGRAVTSVLWDQGVSVLPTDLPLLDVLNPSIDLAWFKPTLIIHLAANKHAPKGEAIPHELATLNIEGTANMVALAETYGARLLTASTCKAIEPETVYGASKLIAERLTLNAGGSVVRFYNVVQSSGNVFEIWRDIPAAEPIPYTHCQRYFITLSEAVYLTLHAAVAPAGRYTLDPGEALRMDEVAALLYPNRDRVEIAPRQGDRLAEPRHGQHEHIEPHGELDRIVAGHDTPAPPVELPVDDCCGGGCGPVYRSDPSSHAEASA